MKKAQKNREKTAGASSAGGTGGADGAIFLYKEKPQVLPI